MGSNSLRTPRSRVSRQLLALLGLIAGTAGTLVLLGAVGAPAADVQDVWWIEDAAYDSRIPTLDAHLGRPFAELHTTVDEMLRYCELLAQSSDRVTLQQIGRSVQGDPLLLLVITDPGNLANLDERSTRIQIVRDPWSTTQRQRREAEDGLLPVTWIACSVHGDEASGTEAGLLLAYHLAADQSAETARILRDTVILIGPSHNPDGRRRFLQQVRDSGRTRNQPGSSPHVADGHRTWAGGRTNHFVFDLNRDWAFLTQQETRHHVAAFLKWRPQVFVDLHEMGRESSYFFPPPAEPVNPNVPEEHREWYEVFGRANANAFDEWGFEYFVREDFDLFYPGYGDTWPSLLGAVGMTYEQATTRAQALSNPDGRIDRYREAVLHHFVAAHTTVRTAAARDRELVQSYTRFHELGHERATRDLRRELILDSARHRAEADRLAQILASQGIEVFRMSGAQTLRLRPYVGGQEREVEIGAGSYRVPLQQPSYALVRSLLDPHVPMDEEFLEEERWRRDTGLSNRFYDVTAWSLVLSYGVEAWYSSVALEAQSEPVEAGASRRGELISGESSPAEAWLVPYDDNAAVQALIELFRAGVRVSCALDGFRSEGVDFPRGSLVIERRANPHLRRIGQILSVIASETGARFFATGTTRTEHAHRRRSDRVISLRVPRVGVLNGPGLDPLSAGGLNWLLEHRYGLDFTSMPLRTLSRAELAAFDVLIVPELRDRERLPLDELDAWVRSGGLLITVGSAAAALLEPGSPAQQTAAEPWSTVRLIRDLAELADEGGRIGAVQVLRAQADGTEQHPPLRSLRDVEARTGAVPPERQPLRTPGAIALLRLDSDHYLTLGEEERAYAPVLSDRLLLPSIHGRNVATFDDEEPRVSGFMWEVMEEALRGKAYLVEEERGRGRVIMFAEDPGFRGIWEGLHRLLLNATLIGPSIPARS